MVHSEDRKPRLTIGRLLLLAAALGLTIAVLVPPYRRVGQAAALRRTIADIRVWEDAIAAYKAVHGVLPTNPGGEITFAKKIIWELRPFLKRIRTSDWWGSRYLIWLGPRIDEYGLASSSADDVLIVSKGRKGIREAWRFESARPEAGFFELAALEDFEKDLVVWNGRPVRWPAGWR